MWFKNLQVFQLEQDWTLPPGGLEAVLAQHTLQPCPAMSLQSHGWVPPIDDAALVQSLERHLLIALGSEHKLLPSSVVNDAAKAKAAAWEKSRGFKPGRKLLREFRDEAANELLPRAFTRRRTTRAWIDPVARRIIVDAASPNRAEELLNHLRDALGELAVKLPSTTLSPAEAMTGWLATDNAPGRFALGEECELSGTEDSKPVVRYLRHPLQGSQLRRHLDNGFRVSRLALAWNARVSLVVNDKLQIKRVTALDIDETRAGEGERSAIERFETDFALMAGDHSAMLDDLLLAFDGR
jgi:recombination associated protein RdgC